MFSLYSFKTSLMGVIVLTSLVMAIPAADAGETAQTPSIIPNGYDFSIWSVVNGDSLKNGDSDRGDFSPLISFSDKSGQMFKEERVWGGVFLALGFSTTLYGYLYRETYYSSKNITREFVDDNSNDKELTFTLYSKRHANPQTALLSSIGLFCNGSYWMLKDRVDGVDLEDYSPLFSERNMAWYSIAFGTLMTSAAFFIPEYNDKVRRGYERVTEPGGRVLYLPIQDESREYSYRQTAVNVGAGMIYTIFGIYKLLTADSSISRSATAPETRHGWSFSITPTIEPAGAVLSVRL